jgi:hypothetical protein
MNVSDIYNLYKTKNFNNLINTFYNNLNIIESYFSVQYSQKYSSLDKLFNNYKNNPSNKTYVLIIKELVLFLLRRFSHKTIKENHKNIFFIIKINNNLTYQLFILYSLIYHSDSNNNKLFIGIDYEFNNKEVALCQMSFYPKRKLKYIFIFNPHSHNFDYLIKYVFLSENIKKILHGSDSLDIPYIYSVLKDKDNITKFTNTIIDTRFLCEYYKFISKHQDNKCSLYTALLYFNTIDTNFYDYIKENEKKLGKIYKIKWNIQTITNKELEYVLYDVLYLKDFYFDIIKKAQKHNIRDLYIFNYVILLTHFVYQEKFGITNIIDKIKNFVDSMNNNYIKTQKENITLHDVYKNMIEKLPLFVNLLSITTFKNYLTYLLKFQTYIIISNNTPIYKDKEVSHKYKEYDLYQMLNNNNYIQIRKLMELYTEEIKNIHEI